MKKFGFGFICLIVMLCTGLVSCGSPLATRRISADLTLTFVLDPAFTGAAAEGSRFLMHDTASVNIWVATKADPATVLGSVTAVPVADGEGNIRASASFENMPARVPLVVTAEIPGSGSVIISRGSGDVTLAGSGATPVRIAILPTDEHPKLLTIIPGVNTISPGDIAGGEYRIIRVNLDSSFSGRQTVFSWSLPYASDFSFAVRNPSGANIAFTPRDSGALGLEFMAAGSGAHYAILKNRPNADLAQFNNLVVPLRVYYDGNGHTGGSVPENLFLYIATNPITVADPGLMEKDGYDFNHWNTKSDGSGMQYFPPEDIHVFGNSNLILYAQWVLQN